MPAPDSLVFRFLTLRGSAIGGHIVSYARLPRELAATFETDHIEAVVSHLIGGSQLGRVWQQKVSIPDPHRLVLGGFFHQTNSEIGRYMLGLDLESNKI